MVTDIISDEHLDHAFHGHLFEYCDYYPDHQWELSNIPAASEPEVVLSLMTQGAVWACSLCVQWDDCGNRIKVHLMDQ